MIAVLMVHAMDSDPSSWRILQGAYAQDREGVLEPLGALETSMRQKTMVAYRNP